MTESSIQDAYHGDPLLLVLADAAAARPGLRTKLAGATFTGADELPSTAFAWPEQRRFPVHTEADTLASIVYRAKLASAPAHVDQTLARAAAAWGIDASVLRVAEPVTKVAAAPPEYAVPSQGRLPLGSPAQVKVAEEVLLRDGLGALEYAELVDGATKVASAAQALGVELTADMRRFAGAGACHVPTLRQHLEGRAAFAKTAEARADYDALTDAVTRHEARNAPVTYDAGALRKVAMALHKIDVRHGVDADYGNPRVLDPMRAVFNTTFRQKAAAAPEAMVTLAGQAVPCSALARLGDAGWRDLGLDDLAAVAANGDVRNLDAQLRVLPRGVQSEVAAAALQA